MKDIELTSQLIEGEFPEYQQIIPAKHNTRTIVSTEAFLGACKRAEIFAREGSYIVKLNINPGDNGKPGEIEISAQSEETGSNETTVDATVEGPSIIIGFNVRFLREVLDVINTPNVALETSAPAAQGVVHPLGEEGFLHVIMPINL